MMADSGALLWGNCVPQVYLYHFVNMRRPSSSPHMICFVDLAVEPEMKNICKNAH